MYFYCPFSPDENIQVYGDEVNRASAKEGR
jgi:hypothetical protein